ncbi:MAG: hypothetical protein LBH34_02895, partial [Prevotellaceae bacterium]|nr:hypothetical protein [Prevotellaceae bacterium]
TPGLRASNDILLQDGLTKVADNKLQGDYSLSGIYVSSTVSNNSGRYAGTGSVKTITSSVKSTITLPALDSIAEFKFWIKAVEDDVPILQVRRQINGGAWEVVSSFTENSKTYVEKSIQLDIAAKNVRLQLYVEKSSTQAGYYFDDFLVTKCTDCIYKEASFAPIFTSNMVLQRNAKVRIFGAASEGLPLTLEIQGKSYNTISSNGGFEFQVDTLAVGGPYSMKLLWDGGAKQVDDVFVGDVWLAGGQSNMAYSMQKVDDFEREQLRNSYPQIKYYAVPKDYYDGHNKPFGSWVSCTSENLKEVYAVAFYFAREVYKEEQVPIGIVQCGLGGTSAESWMSREALLADSRFSKELLDYDSVVSTYAPGEYEDLLAKYAAGEIKTEPAGPKNFRRPAGLYYTMFRKITPYTFKGVIFYQGETNAKRGYGYRTLFPALIDLWRNDLEQPELPFLFVQLPRYKSAINWADIRESQLLVARAKLNTGMAVAFDQGNPNDIHPTRKDTVGMRLAKVALAKVYKKNIPYSGPEYRSMNIRKEKVILHFNHAEGGLVARGGVLKGFSVCGDDENFILANAIIEGDSIIISSSSISNPTHVRYGWFSDGDISLYNTEGLPASPFRTDNFKLATESDLGGGNSEESRLLSINVNGMSIPNFNRDSMEYMYSLPPSATSNPVVSAVALDNNATIGIDQVISLAGSLTQRTATITVTAEDLWTVSTYKVIFDLNGIEEVCSTCLQDIIVNSESLSNFHQDSLNYAVLLNASTKNVPVVSAIPLNSKSDVVIRQARSITSLSEWDRMAIITVNSEDMTEEQMYTLIFTVDESTGISADALENKLNIRVQGGKILSVEGDGQLQIYSMQGMLMYNARISGYREVKLPMAGIFFIHLKGLKQSYVKKVIVRD